jgi:hypothetical protein
MKLQDEKIVFLRNTSESWDLFENNDGVHALPKYDSFIMIPTGKVGTFVDYRVVPTYRKDKYYYEASRWATHYAIIVQFLKSDKEYLFVCEDNLQIQEKQISQIETFGVKGGIYLFSNTDKPAQAYILDKYTAEIIRDNTYVFYKNWEEMLFDLKNLDLIKLEQIPILKKIDSSNSMLLHILFIILLFCMIIGLFFMLCPFDSFRSKNVISLTEMLGAKESMICTKGTGMSCLQDSVVSIN